MMMMMMMFQSRTVTNSKYNKTKCIVHVVFVYVIRFDEQIKTIFLIVFNHDSSSNTSLEFHLKEEEEKEKFEHMHTWH